MLRVRRVCNIRGMRGYNRNSKVRNSFHSPLSALNYLDVFATRLEVLIFMFNVWLPWSRLCWLRNSRPTFNGIVMLNLFIPSRRCLP